MWWGIYAGTELYISNLIRSTQVIDFPTIKLRKLEKQIWYMFLVQVPCVMFLLSLQNSSVQDDTLLEVINVCGTFSLDEKCARLLVQEGLPDLLISVLKGKQSNNYIDLSNCPNIMY